MAAALRAFFDQATNTVTYLLWDKATRIGAIIDPVLDWDNRSGEADTRSADAVLAAAAEEGLRLEWVLETHVHADHLTASPYVKARTGARIGIGEHIREVQAIFRPVFGAEDVLPDGGDFDRLFADGEEFALGTLTLKVLHVPGHTPACVAYLVEDMAFVGDTLFMPDYGTARCDFPGGDARTLWHSIRRLLALPPETRLLTCHDYKAPGREEFAWESTVAEQRARNPHVHDGMTEEQFVAQREARDAKLAPPLLLLPSIQVNMRAGRFPPAEANGVRYMRIPVTLKGGLRGANTQAIQP
ncbi:MBL fold metallo-hydrolase [Siccirubricoccus sp. KC 17139]|uniref:MBL fold metallo-hydrolase n=1 Tax=Siccirubricoccus soli TaxID=2899147 RepID=A0ABT1D421_9PROT|nr:MBL fold metallo-hydrolase [Siccirubricoccus soli]MCO6416673.1 MBL fold metallo-hydrolase [Siccirubricoccus soli]MCP2682808.1 MBL fold metallo-hydrolase [Siccirubricoccus soli]